MRRRYFFIQIASFFEPHAYIIYLNLLQMGQITGAAVPKGVCPTVVLTGAEERQWTFHQLRPRSQRQTTTNSACWSTASKLWHVSNKDKVNKL